MLHKFLSVPTKHQYEHLLLFASGAQIYSTGKHFLASSECQRCATTRNLWQVPGTAQHVQNTVASPAHDRDSADTAPMTRRRRRKKVGGCVPDRTSVRCRPRTTP